MQMKMHFIIYIYLSLCK